MEACRLPFKLRIRIGKQGDLSNFECGIVVYATWASLSISEIVEIFRDYKECSKKEKLSSQLSFCG